MVFHIGVGSDVVCSTLIGNSESRVTWDRQQVGSPTLFYARKTKYKHRYRPGENDTQNDMAAMANEYLYINTRDELVRLDCHKIVYFEGDSNYTNIVLINKQKVSVCINLCRMQQLLSENLRERASNFARIGKRFIVNLNFVYRVQPLQKSLVVTDGVNFTFQLGISKEALKQLKDILVRIAYNNGNQPLLPKWTLS